MNSLTFIVEDPAEPDGRPRKIRVQKHSKPRLTPALYKASVKTLADTSTIRVSSSTAGIDDAILERIKKCLERASHKNTPEPEAKAAFYMASRLMGQYNVTQAEVLAHESPATQQQYAGQSVVSIQRADSSNKAVNRQGFVRYLGSAMCEFFDCKSYSTQKHASMEWTFYGIAENTAAAAMAFEMAYNLISEWARPYKGNGSKNSYCIGVAKELYRMAEKEKRAQEKQALEAEGEALRMQIEHEEEQRQAELDRLAFFPSSPEETAEDDTNDLLETEDSDSEDASENEAAPDFMENEIQIDPQANLDIEIMKLVKSESATPPPLGQISSPSSPITLASGFRSLPNQDATSKSPSTIKKETDDEPNHTTLWASSRQLTTFRKNASRIAEDYLKDSGIKLSNSRSRFSGVSDYSAYLQGTRDSKKIDIHRKRIEA